MSEFIQFLRSISACDDAVDWVGEKSLQEAWETCPRGDWMLWLAHKMGVEKRVLVGTATECAATVYSLMSDAGKNAVAVGRRYAIGQSDDIEFQAAVNADDAACRAATYASYAATYAANAAAAAAANDDDADDAKAENQNATADIVRSMIPVEMIVDLIQ